mmetsp:Transcript_116895/g.162397  ORF Transcript_116895/g.162397 Transcript_116895/m.162397 type:complete len:216 (-) Transcript_116895:832-1479(-)
MVLDLNPSLKNILNVGKKSNLLHNLSLEGSNVSLSVHLVQVHLMLLKLLLDIGNTRTKTARLVDSAPCDNSELSLVPIGLDIVAKSIFKLELLVGRLSDFLNVFLDAQDVATKDLAQVESLRLVRKDAVTIVGININVFLLLLDKLNDFLPMAITNGRLGKSFDKRELIGFVINLLLELSVGIPALENTRKSHALTSVGLNLFDHLLDLTIDINP